MTDKAPRHTLKDRIERRLFVEGEPLNDAGYYGLEDWSPECDSRDLALFHPDTAARIAALEAEDSFNPIAATSAVRPSLTLADPDLEALTAAGWIKQVDC